MYKVLFYTGTFNIKNMFQFPVLEHPFIRLFNCLGLLFFGSFLHFYTPIPMHFCGLKIVLELYPLYHNCLKIGCY